MPINMRAIFISAIVFLLAGPNLYSEVARIAQGKAEYAQFLWGKSKENYRLRLSFLGKGVCIRPNPSVAEVRHLAAATIYVAAPWANKAVDELCDAIKSGDYTEAPSDVDISIYVSIEGPWDSIALEAAFSNDHKVMELYGKKFITNSAIIKWLNRYVDPLSKVVENMTDTEKPL